MKIVSIDKNGYGRKFTTIKVEHNEICSTEVLLGSSYMPKDLSGKYHEIRVEPFHGNFVVGCGNGSAMGWTYNLTEKQAHNIARAFCAYIEESTLVAHVYFKI